MIKAVSVVHCSQCKKPMHDILNTEGEYAQFFKEPVDGQCAVCFVNNFEPESLEADPLSNGYYFNQIDPLHTGIEEL